MYICSAHKHNLSAGAGIPLAKCMLMVYYRITALDPIQIPQHRSGGEDFGTHKITAIVTTITTSRARARVLRRTLRMSTPASARACIARTTRMLAGYSGADMQLGMRAI